MINKKDVVKDRVETIINSSSPVWESQSIKDKVFDFVYSYILSRDNIGHGDTTPMFLFEIELMNRGFEMVAFSKLNAMIPCGRQYQKNGVNVYLEFNNTGRVARFNILSSTMMYVPVPMVYDVLKFNELFNKLNLN